MAPRDPGGAATIEIAQPQQKTVLSDMLRRLAAASGRPLGPLLRDFVKTSFGPGKLNFDEFIALGLYDPGRCAGADLRSFIGLGAMQKIWRQANYRTEFDGLVGNKVAMAALLRAYGFPTIPIGALASTAAGRAAERTLCTKEAIKDFLCDPAHYPLFGKPVTGWQSLGSASFSGYDPARKMLLGYGDRPRALDDYVDEITTHYGVGYLFQRRLSPHSATRAICGDRLATVRAVTICGESGPRLLRACEKMPAGANVADNFWRPGNLLVQIDMATGRRGRVISGKGFETAEHSHHPDSGAPITGTQVPNWNAVRELALEAAGLVKETALTGWDIAPTDSGAVIVEANPTPDLMLPQLADRRGILDAEMLGFLEERKRSERTWRREVRARGLQQHRVSFMN